MTTDLTVPSNGVTNRLALPAAGKRGKVTHASLIEYAAELNTMRWVQISGKPYFINKRDKPGSTTGEIEHFLDRNA